jgi:hypothetical protein
MQKNMPRRKMKAMRFLVERILAAVERWEDKHADPGTPADYRRGELTTGLWQASQALRALIEGESDLHRPEPWLGTVNARDDGGRYLLTTVLGKEFERELLAGAPIPMRPVDN